MSQRPAASRPASHSPSDAQNTTQPPVLGRVDVQQAEQQGDPQPAERLEGQQSARQASQLLPSPSPQYGRLLQPAPPGEEWRSGRSRDLGVHSMLNPTEPEDSSSSGRQVSGGEADSPLSAAGPHSQFGTSPSISAQHTFPGQQPGFETLSAQSSYSATFPRARPILTPRSPRNFSLGRGRGQATIDAARSPFLPSRGRAYTAEPGQSASSDVPSMPTHGSTQGHQHHDFPPTASTPRRASATMQAPLRTPHSESASPSISQSSQNLSSSQTSPASYLYKGGQPPSTQGYFPGSTFAQAGGGVQFGAGPGGQAGPSSATEGPYSAPPPPSHSQGPPAHSSTVSSSPAEALSSRQSSASDPIQVLTITTSQGVFNVPVDVRQASRLADEKRARNAGASARFRQRRKEKEREASTTIEKYQSQSRDLERKVRELEQERDFYRGERDRFRDVVFRTPDMRHLVMQAPPSPQSMRTASFQGPGMAPGGPPQQPPAMGFQLEPQPERAPRRRRTDASGEFASVPYTLPPASTLPPVQAAGYPSGPTNLPPLRIENPTAQTQTRGPNVTATTTAGPLPPFDPYARVGPPGSYERSWPSERGGRR
ncbi:Transcription factor zip1 [Hyphodiscus hymeniophilus]|uniref:Transcription factor zip1 n=1 Tax=Hyphodiscus hymeniophilus TaxID=353542 RepID=A0A9P6VIZ5_9HELO|nr:Transcription factor zip1 [Hyphodiscus hymeniophilus]